MIIWLNGPFGVGKSSVAKALHARIPDSFICDPEEIGFMLRRVLPQSLSPSDFQYIPLWREFAFGLLQYNEAAYRGATIVPMTLVDVSYFQQIVERLRNSGVTVHHFTPMATRPTLLHRLNQRGDAADSWSAQQIERCLNALYDAMFQVHLDTEEQSIDSLADEVMRRMDIK